MNYLKRWAKSFLGISAILIGIVSIVCLAGAAIGFLGSAIQSKFGDGAAFAYAVLIFILVVSGIMAVEPKS